MLDYYVDKAEEFLKPGKVEANPAAGTAQLAHQPLGVICAVRPWNATAYQAVRPACGNLMRHCHAQARRNRPSAEAIEKIFLDGGVPVGVFTNIRAKYDQAEERHKAKEAQQQEGDQAGRDSFPASDPPGLLNAQPIATCINTNR